MCKASMTPIDSVALGEHLRVTDWDFFLGRASRGIALAMLSTGDLIFREPLIFENRDSASSSAVAC